MIDASLTETNAAAQAKAVGDRINDINDTIMSIDRNLDAVEEILLDEVPVSLGVPTKGVFETNGPASLSSNKYVYFPKLGGGTFTITPATGWSFEFYKYLYDSINGYGGNKYVAYLMIGIFVLVVGIVGVLAA